jgi:hypothetical protein
MSLHQAHGEHSKLTTGIHTHTHAHICTHTHTHTHTLTHMHTHTHTCTHSHTHAHICTHTHTHAHTRTHMHTHSHAHTHTLTHMHTHSHAHSHICTNMHTHSHAHTHAHTCTRTRAHTHMAQAHRNTLFWPFLPGSLRLWPSGWLPCFHLTWPSMLSPPPSSPVLLDYLSDIIWIFFPLGHLACCFDKQLHRYDLQSGFWWKDYRSLEPCFEDWLSPFLVEWPWVSDVPPWAQFSHLWKRNNSFLNIIVEMR